ncbi:MAG: hypothetical protein Q9M50_00925 [Methylococcales bacterium]|nr:hypothetical protein [Methylococcales bacterium]
MIVIFLWSPNLNLSSVGRELCISACIKIYQNDGSLKGHVVLDIDLNATLIFFTGESRRVYFEPAFKFMYSMIVIGLLAVSLIVKTRMIMYGS